MIRALISAIAAVAATVVVYAGQQAQPQSPAPQKIWWGTPNKNFLVLVPVSGTWNADYEKYDTKFVQVLTIDGAAARRAPDADAARMLFGDKSAGFVTALAAPGAFPLAVARDIKAFPPSPVKTLSGGKLGVSFKLVSGATDQTAGIVVGLQPDGSYTFVQYNAKDGNVAVGKFEKGVRTVLQQGEVHQQLPLNQWHTLEVTIGPDYTRTGAVVSASVKGSTLAVRHTLPAPVQGRVGVWTKADSVTSFKDFVAVPLYLGPR